MSEFWMNLHEIAERKIEEYHAERRRAARHPHFYSRGSYRQDTWPKRPIKVPAGLGRKLAAIQAEFRDHSPETMARRRKDKNKKLAGFAEPTSQSWNLTSGFQFHYNMMEEL